MGYAKIIKYGNFIEVYRYENDVRPVARRSRALQAARRSQSFTLSREAEVERKQQAQRKRADNAKRVYSNFKRLVLANLAEFDKPIFASFTYSTHIVDVRKGRKDFNTFARNLRAEFGRQVRYIVVPEFQKSGRLHFHALLWGLPAGLVARERATRLVASLWKQGFIDLIETDGHEKLAHYIAKYMGKAQSDSRFFGQKAYICSSNIIRPFIDKKPIFLAYEHEYQLSTITPLLEKDFYSYWLGEAKFTLYQLLGKDIKQ